MRVYAPPTRGPGTVRRAAGVIIRRGDRWLLLRNAREGHWGFAKGHLEEGEHELAGALREVREETGLLPRLDPVFREAIRYTVPATKKRPASEKEVVYFLGSVGAHDDAKASDEHDRVEWLSLDECMNKIEHEQLRALLARAVRFATTREI
jgi:8-oxo-dGTP pyrophosphatase MutT (NUDIX family)